MGGLFGLEKSLLGTAANAEGGIWKGIGGGLSAANPFHKIDVSAPPTLTAPGQVTAGPGGKIQQNVAGPDAGFIPQEVAGPNASTLQGVGAGSHDAFRQAQLNTINGLQGVANGSVNPAQTLMNQAMAQNTAQQFAMANSARGGAGASAMRAAMNNAQVNNAQAAAQGAQMGLNNRMAASGLIGNIAGQGSGQDISVAGQNADLGTQASIAGFQGNTQRAIAQGGLDTNASIAGFNGNTQRAIAQGGLDRDAAALGVQAQQYNANNTLGYNGQLQGQWGAVNNLSVANQQYQRQQIGNFIGGVAGGLGTASSMGLFGSSMGPNGSTGQGVNSVSQGTNPDFMGPPSF